jgi:hypothetical protein
MFSGMMFVNDHHTHGRIKVTNAVQSPQRQNRSAVDRDDRLEAALKVIADPDEAVVTEPE